MTTSEETPHTHSDCLCCEASDVIGRLFRRLGPSENVAEHFRQAVRHCESDNDQASADEARRLLK